MFYRPNFLVENCPSCCAFVTPLTVPISRRQVSARDFSRAMDGIVPTAQRSATAPGHALAPVVRPLLGATVSKALNTLLEGFPAFQLAQKASLDAPGEWSGCRCSSFTGGDICEEIVDNVLLVQPQCSDTFPRQIALP